MLWKGDGGWSVPGGVKFPRKKGAGNEIRCRHFLLEFNDETSRKYWQKQKKKGNEFTSQKAKFV
jgi:hypothetical protein